MAMRDLFDNISEHLRRLFENNRSAIQRTYTEFTTQEFVVFKAQQMQLAMNQPTIEIVRGAVNSAWAATRVIDEQYNYFLDCSIKHASRETAKEFVTVFGRAIQLVLNDFQNLRFDVPNITSVRAFDSFAAGSDPNYRKSLAVVTNRVTWMCKISNLVNSPGVGRFIA